MGVIAAGKYLVVAVADRPALAQPGGELLGQAAGAKVGGKHIVGRVNPPGDARLRPVCRAHAYPGACGGPAVAHQRAFDGRVKRARKSHGSRTRDTVLQHAGVVPTDQGNGHSGPQGRKRGVRVHKKTPKRVGQRKAGGHLVSHGHGPQHLLHIGVARFGFRQQSRQGVGAAMAGGIAKTLVEFAPGDGHAIGAGGRVAVCGLRAWSKYRGFLERRAAVDKVLAGLSHLRLHRAGHHGANIVGKNGGSAPANDWRQGRSAGLGRPFKQQFGMFSGRLSLI